MARLAHAKRGKRYCGTSEGDHVFMLADLRLRLAGSDPSTPLTPAARIVTTPSLEDRPAGSSPAVSRRSLRILHVSPYSPDAWAYGGIPRVLGVLTRALARRGHRVTLCTTDACSRNTRLPAGDGRPGSELPGTIRMRDGVEWRVFRNASNALAYSWQLFLPLRLTAYLREHATAFDIAHLHACRNLPGTVAARQLRSAGIPFVVSPHGTAPLIERRILAKRAYDLLLGRRALGDPASILAVSDAERAQLLDLGVPAEAIRVVRNPVDLDEFVPPVTRGRFRRQLGAGGEPIVLFLGKLTPRKRLDVLIRAFAVAAGSRARLVVAGNDMGAGGDARWLCRSLGLEHRSHFTGLLRGHERLEALADADVVVYPSEHEVFGLVPLEALLAGTPVVVADDSGCGEIVRTTGGGLVVPQGDVRALGDAVRRILDDPGLWRAATAPAAERIRASYHADGVCRQLEAVYSDVIAGRLPGSACTIAHS